MVKRQKPAIRFSAIDTWMIPFILFHIEAGLLSSFCLFFIFVCQLLFFVFVVIRYTFTRTALQALGVSFNALDTPREMTDIVFLTAFTAYFSCHFNSSS